ncbi:MAG: aldo/keto reductase [candidate division Zixibacteria bacterium]|nr:aldo/keto reductase [candidate division Zixibacteria bacterium]MDH3938472.1 aldo/keto reductase [candidate division Zixibacteria bacterium]MDH4032418.1 aldo/keto reductase [candidate division Zixibacteria bacterium]
MDRSDFTAHRPLGRTGLKVSRLGLASAYGTPAATVEKAFHEYNINYFYWGALRTRGMRDGLRNLAANNRENMIVALQSFDHFGITLSRSIKKGLRTLDLDYADVLVLGWHNKSPSERIIAKAIDMKEAGLVRHIALSGHNRSLFGKLAQLEDSSIDIFMVRYNAVHRGAEGDIFPYLSDHDRPGITVFTATCWAKLLKQKKMPPGEESLSAADCYRFVLSDPHVDLCMMGPRNEREFDEGVTALAKGPLSDDEMIRIRKIGDYIHR